MKYKTRVLIDRFIEILSKWPGVECVTLNEAALPDTLDPYFALIFDVFCSGPIPNSEERCQSYGDDAAFFESSGYPGKDRFLIDEVPVRLEFKFIEKIEELVTIADTKTDSLWLIKDSGTYSFYRLASGEIVFSRSEWINDIRKRLENLPGAFWIHMRDAAQSKMEHFLSDLGAAAFQGDKFHYQIASAGFIKNACLVLFCVNRRFEPSHRAYYNQVLELPVLPPSFHSHFDYFLNVEAEAELERNFKAAMLLAKGIVIL
jgi:hypothetical protein